MFRGNQQTAQMMTTKSTSRVTFRFALIVSGRTLSAGLGGGMFETESFDPISGNYKTFNETLFKFEVHSLCKKARGKIKCVQWVFCLLKIEYSCYHVSD